MGEMSGRVGFPGREALGNLGERLWMVHDDMQL